MKRDAWKRLEAMEARAKAAKIDRSPEAVFALVMPVLVAAGLGGWREHESVASAYARAIGLKTRDLVMAFNARDVTDLQARHATTVRRLFHDVGVEIDGASAESIEAATERMIAALPIKLRGLIGRIEPT